MTGFEGFFWTMAGAVLIGTTYVAYDRPKQYEKLSTILALGAAFLGVVLGASVGGLNSSLELLLPYIAVDQLSDAQETVQELALPLTVACYSLAAYAMYAKAIGWLLELVKPEDSGDSK